MEISAKTVHERGLDGHQSLKDQVKAWTGNTVKECKDCIACHDYPEGQCCTVQAEQYGKPYLIKDMEKCPGRPSRL